MSDQGPISFTRTHAKPSLETHDRAHDLRLHQTRQEWAVWRILRGQKMGVKFRRQQAIGPYITDFYCSELKLIIEVDGGQHNASVDQKRNAYIQSKGLIILRFWNNDIDRNIDDVHAVIAAKIYELKNISFIGQ